MAVSIDVTIKALEDRGVARRLAEPNLIARSGQKASFLAGGEVPIPVVEETAVITVEYKKFGVGLDFTPTVLADGLISLDIDRRSRRSTGPLLQHRQYLASPVSSVRRAPHLDRSEERPELHDGRPVCRRENDMIQQRVPGLGKLPVLGPLFSSRAYQRRETDLVIIVTPYLVKPMDPSKKPRFRPTTRPGEQCRLLPRQQGRNQGFRCGRALDQSRRHRGAASDRATSSICRRISSMRTLLKFAVLVEPDRPRLRLHERRIPAAPTA